MATVGALLGGPPSAADAADMDSIAAIWTLMARTIRDAGNNMEQQLAAGLAARTDVLAAQAIVAARQVYPTYDDVDTSGFKTWTSLKRR